jgi:hypothetical protein
VEVIIVFIKIMVALSIFGAGFIIGMAAERASLRIADNKTTLIYEGSVYVQVIQGVSFEDYLTAAGKKK